MHTCMYMHVCVCTDASVHTGVNVFNTIILSPSLCNNILRGMAVSQLLMLAIMELYILYGNFKALPNIFDTFILLNLPLWQKLVSLHSLTF